MGVFIEGDVVLAKVPVEVGGELKTRPAVIVEVQGSFYTVFGCHHDTSKAQKYEGLVIMKNSMENDFYRFDKDTFINFTHFCKAMDGRAIKRKIGKCPRMHLDDFRKYVADNNLTS